jgi:hypothetical protein
VFSRSGQLLYFYSSSCQLQSFISFYSSYPSICFSSSLFSPISTPVLPPVIPTFLLVPLPPASPPFSFLFCCSYSSFLSPPLPPDIYHCLYIRFLLLLFCLIFYSPPFLYIPHFLCSLSSPFCYYSSFSLSCSFACPFSFYSFSPSSGFSSLSSSSRSTSYSFFLVFLFLHCSSFPYSSPSSCYSVLFSVLLFTPSHPFLWPSIRGGIWPRFLAFHISRKQEIGQAPPPHHSLLLLLFSSPSQKIFPYSLTSS